MACNASMDDATLIHDLGGPAKLADRLGCSVQRVHNWLTRGIPPKVKLKHPDILLPELTGRTAAANDAAPEAATAQG